MQIIGLTVGYYHKKLPITLFEDIHLNLNGGELICFMGPNGIGKSSLIRTLAGLQKPLGGTISHTSAKEIAVVLTDRITSANMTVSDLVAFGRYPYLGWNISMSSEDHKIIDNALKAVRIENIASKKLLELSDGQFQMAMIARVLAQDTPVLLLDEPTAHLDLNNRVEIMNLLRHLAKSMGKAILVATHELDLALQTADRIWLAAPGKKIKAGVPEDLVLDGSFDAVFTFKGFDLKTGKIQHSAFRNISVNLQGEHHQYLWAKNALERTGYQLSESSPTRIYCSHIDQQYQFTITKESIQVTFHSLGTLLDWLEANLS